MLQHVAKRGYHRGALALGTTRNPAWIDPLLTFMVRRGSTLRFRQRASRALLDVLVASNANASRVRARQAGRAAAEKRWRVWPKVPLANARTLAGFTSNTSTAPLPPSCRKAPSWTS
jgi:hypothetical protein